MTIADDYIDSGWQNADAEQGSFYYSGNDSWEAEKMGPYVPTGGGSSGSQPAPWWEGVIKYGIVRAIDNTFPDQNSGRVRGNVNPGTFAGQNGLTYSNGQTVGGLVSAVGQMSPFTLLLLGGAVYLALSE